MNEKKIKYYEELIHLANSYIGLARIDLQNGAAERALIRLNAYCEESDRAEVRYLGADQAAKLLDSGIIHPTAAFADELARLRLAQ